MTRYSVKCQERAFFQTLASFARAHLLWIGVRLELFTALRRPQTAQQLSRDSRLAPDLLQAWLQAAAAHGLIRRARERDHAFEVDGVARWMIEQRDPKPWIALLEEAVEGCGPLFERLPDLMTADERPEFGSRAEARRAAEFSRLVERPALAALDRIPGVASARRVLDVGCGYGGYLVGMLMRYRDAHGVGIEQDPDVAEIAARNLQAADLSRRSEIRIGEFLGLELDPGCYDLILLNNNLYYFAPGKRRALFDRIFSRLVPGAVLAIQTLVVSDRAAARFMGFGANVAAFDLYLRAHENLYGLPDRAELGEALLAAGFENVAEVAFLPGGAARYIWGRVPRAGAARATA
jgi:predicted O-methyltransferase YrrM